MCVVLCMWYIHLCLQTCVHMYVHVQSPSSVLGIFPHLLTIVFILWDRVSHQTWNSYVQLRGQWTRRILLSLCSFWSRLGLWAHDILTCLFFLTWLWGLELRSFCLHGKHITPWVISLDRRHFSYSPDIHVKWQIKIY